MDEILTQIDMDHCFDKKHGQQQKRAAEMRLQGFTWAEIGEAIGLSESGARKTGKKGLIIFERFQQK